jgi:hypothetical protein
VIPYSEDELFEHLVEDSAYLDAAQWRIDRDTYNENQRNIDTRRLMIALRAVEAQKKRRVA